MRKTVILCAVLLVAASSGRVAAQRGNVRTLREKGMVARGLDWLRSRQNPEGSWGCFKGHPPSTGMTALAGMALMAGGSTPTRGPDAPRIKRAILWLMARPRRGLIVTHSTAGISPILEHSWVILFFSEAAGMTGSRVLDHKLRIAARQALATLVKLQQGDGGWGDASSELGVTAGAWNTLRAAQEVGIATGGRPGTLHEWVRKCRREDGSYSEEASPYIYYSTAAGLRVHDGLRSSAGRDSSLTIRLLVGHTLGSQYGGRVSEWCYLGAYFATQTLIHRPHAWRIWYPRVRSFLARRQNADGSWSIEYCTRCQTLSTALSLLVLQAHKRRLTQFTY